MSQVELNPVGGGGNFEEIYPETETGPLEGTVSSEDVSLYLLNSTIARYRDFHNLENGNEGARYAHVTEVTTQYSDHILPVIATMHLHALQESNVAMLDATTNALMTLNSALTIVDTYTDAIGSRSRRSALYSLKSRGARGDDTYYDFCRSMRLARETATTCVVNHAAQIPEDTELVYQDQDKNRLSFYEQANLVVEQAIQAEEGIDLGSRFQERLFSSDTKLVVLSLDINSTLNHGESHANTESVAAAMTEIQGLAATMHENGKEFLVVINTGRPAMYAWGVLEMLSSLPEIRNLGLAEAGGVCFTMEGTQQKVEVAVEQPSLWKENLNRLQMHLLKKIDGKVAVEPKDSMISLQIAKTPDEGGKHLYSTCAGEIVNEAWIKKETEVWFRQTQAELNAQIEILNSNQDGSSVEKLEQALDFSCALEQVLNVSFNQTAGYVDIYHEQLNKFSTLFNKLRSMGYKTEEILAVHIGDAGTDSPPTHHTSVGEYNEGSNTTFVVAVANSAARFKATIRERVNYGFLASRSSVLAVGDVARGINALLVPEEVY